MKSKIIIPGGSGFIGQNVAQFFVKRGYEIIILTRGKTRKDNDISYLNWDGKTLDKWANTFENAELILNLSGKSVDCRYNATNKKRILDSRVLSTQVVGKAIEACTIPPKVWINMSTATIYEHTEEGIANDEINGIIGDDFSMGVAKAWEASFHKFELPNTRKIILRTSIVLGKNGGALKHLKPLVKLGLGGKNGSGKQFVSWIHIEDLSKMIEWVLTTPTTKGIYNCTSPTPITNAFFMKKIRAAFGIPFGLPSYKWMIEIGCILLRSESELVLKSRKVVPKKALEEGFIFQFENLEQALKN